MKLETFISDMVVKHRNARSKVLDENRKSLTDARKAIHDTAVDVAEQMLLQAGNGQVNVRAYKTAKLVMQQVVDIVDKSIMDEMKKEVCPEVLEMIDNL